MTRNHRNRSWCGQWTMHPSGSAVIHKSGFVVSRQEFPGHLYRHKLRPQDDLLDLYQRGLRLIVEEYRRRHPPPEPDPETGNEGPAWVGTHVPF